MKFLYCLFFLTFSSLSIMLFWFCISSYKRFRLVGVVVIELKTNLDIIITQRSSNSILQKFSSTLNSKPRSMLSIFVFKILNSTHHFHNRKHLDPPSGLAWNTFQLLFGFVELSVNMTSYCQRIHPSVGASQVVNNINVS